MIYVSTLDLKSLIAYICVRFHNKYFLSVVMLFFTSRYCTLDLILTNPTLPTKFAPLISESNKVMVIFKSPQANLQSEYLDRVRRGFKLCFKISSVILSNSTASPSPSTESLPPSLPSTSAGPPTKSTEHNEAVAPGAVVKTDPPGKAKHSLTPLIVGIIAALLILLIVFGVIIMVLLYKRKRKQPPPVVTSPVSGMENPGKWDADLGCTVLASGSKFC